MTIRRKTISIICLTFIVLIGLLYTISRKVLLDSYAQLAERSVKQNIKRFQNVLSEDISSLSTNAYDWSAWDDTYAFIEDVNEEYLQSNLTNDTVDNDGLRLNLMLFTNVSREIVYIKRYNLDENHEVPIPPQMIEDLIAPEIINPVFENKFVNGIVLLPEGPLLIAITPIVNSAREGPVRGALMMGRFLDRNELNRFAEITDLSLAMYSFDLEEMAPDFTAIKDSFTQEDQIIIQPIDDQTIAGYFILKDIHGKPALILRADMPNEIYMQGKTSIAYFFLFVLVTGLVMGVVILLLLEKAILNRILGFSNCVKKIGDSKSLSSRINIIGADEFSQLGITINNMMAQLENSEKEHVRTERLRALGEMTAGINHNLNNILVGMMVNSELLMRKVNDPKLLGMVNQIRSSGLQAQDLISRLQLTYLGDLTEKADHSLINSVIHEAVIATQPKWKDESEARGHPIELKFELSEESAPVPVSFSGLFNILLNILFNAVDALPEGGQITITTTPLDGGVQLKIKDNGIGMDEETMKRIFEPFFTTKKELGTGLGLSTVYNTVVRWDGKIAVESALGKGTTFTIWFPTFNYEKTDTEKVIDVPDVRRGKILIVDDQEVVGHLVTALLSDRHDVTQVLNGREALLKFSGDDFDVAVIDLGMPGLPGDHVAREIHRMNPSVTTVLITGWQLPEGDTRLLEFDFRIQKPLNDIDELQQVIAHAIQLCDQRRFSKN